MSFISINKEFEKSNKCNLKKIIKKNSINLSNYGDSVFKKILFISSFVLLSFAPTFFIKYKTTTKIICCSRISKNETNYIKEWAEHAKKIGISKISIYIDKKYYDYYFLNQIKREIKNRYVKINVIEDPNINYTNHCHQKNLHFYKWFINLNINEFIEIYEESNITNIIYYLDNFNDEVDIINLNIKYYDDNNLINIKNNNYSIKKFNHFSVNYDKNYKFKYITKNKFNENIKKVNCLNQKDQEEMIFYPIYVKYYRFKTIEEYYLNVIENEKDKLRYIKLFFTYNKFTEQKKQFLLNKLNKENQILFNEYIENNMKIINIYAALRGNNGNIGDDINISWLTDAMKINYKNIFFDERKYNKDTTYFFIGSILNFGGVDENTVIWGSGIRNINKKIEKSPKKVLAVRGPLTRNQLLKQNIECPEIYGDPALLIPLYYYPKIKKLNKFCVIPHFVNINNPLIDLIFIKNNIKFLKVEHYVEWTDFLDQLISCENIFSESLHGLIFAEAYSIPNLWISIHPYKKYEIGDDVKFQDFFTSLGKSINKSFPVNVNTTLSDLINEIDKYQRVFRIDLEKLINSCPFKLDVDINQINKIYNITPNKTNSQNIIRFL